MLPVVALAAGAAAQSSIPPAKGVFLVARSRIDAGPFERSVVLLLAHEVDGTLGVIVNQPTGVPLSEALPGLDVGGTEHELYFGGPVAIDGLLVLFRSESPPRGARRVMDDVYFSGEQGVLEELLKEGKTAEELRLFMGHSGWAPGQLDGELRTGAWEVVPADRLTLFKVEPQWMWETLTRGRMEARRPGSGSGPRGSGIPFGEPPRRASSR